MLENKIKILGFIFSLSIQYIVCHQALVFITHRSLFRTLSIFLANGRQLLLGYYFIDIAP